MKPAGQPAVLCLGALVPWPGQVLPPLTCGSSENRKPLTAPSWEAGLKLSQAVPEQAWGGGAASSTSSTVPFPLRFRLALLFLAP